MNWRHKRNLRELNRIAMSKGAKGKSNPAPWGILPEEAKDIIRRREWDKSASLKARLSGTKEFPIRLGLKPPKGNSALADMLHFQRFINEWKTFPHQDLVQWSTKTFRDLAEQRIPTFIVITSIQNLIDFLGSDALSRSKIWERNMMPLLQLDNNLYPALVKHLETIEKLCRPEAELLARLIPQLQPGMGKGLYQRALPLIGIDTKFLEHHQILVEELINTIHQGAVLESGGLTSWLHCTTPPKDWLIVRPLCPETSNKLGGIPILKMAGNSLRRYELPASNILVVENMQSGLALPIMPDTIAVIGGGKNVAWMDAPWLRNKRLGYWGDIDSWGLSILSDVREKGVTVQPLMMDLKTVILHEKRMVVESKSVKNCPASLTEDEVKLFNDLLSGRFQSSRLEQERLSADYINSNLMEWLSEVN